MNESIGRYFFFWKNEDLISSMNKVEVFWRTATLLCFCDSLVAFQSIWIAAFFVWVGIASLSPDNKTDQFMIYLRGFEAFEDSIRSGTSINSIFPRFNTGVKTTSPPTRSIEELLKGSRGRRRHDPRRGTSIKPVPVNVQEESQSSREVKAHGTAMCSFNKFQNDWEADKRRCTGPSTILLLKEHKRCLKEDVSAFPSHRLLDKAAEERNNYNFYRNLPFN